MTNDPMEKVLTASHIHAWLKQAHVCYLPGPSPTLLATKVAAGILNSFRQMGHVVQERPDHATDILLTSSPYGKPLSWRSSLLLTGRMRYRLDHSPTVFTLIHARPEELAQHLNRLSRALEKEVPDAADYDFPGLASGAYRVLHEQGRRGGPILALERLLQAQSKCINVLLLVGEEQPISLYHFDLVGAYPQSPTDNLDSFHQDIVLRMVTRVSTQEITQHINVQEPISHETWRSLESPAAMSAAARRLDARGFFTEMVRIDDLVHVPAVQQAVSSQYSEGCFATWDPEIAALIATVTGSARPVNKGEITEKDLAVIVGVRDDHLGVLVRRVQGMPNDPPSSEAVEMMDMDQDLPRFKLAWGSASGVEVPVIRSKLHGHRGISAYNPDYVEFVPLAPPYYAYPVTCATAAQAQGIRQAFARSQALQNPADPRQIVFTVLPTHGVVIVEKWVPETAPFQTIWEYLDSGRLVLDRRVPQGHVTYAPSNGNMILVESD